MSWACSWWESTGRDSIVVTAECPEGHETREDLGVLPSGDVEWTDRARWPEQCATCGHVYEYCGDDRVSRSLSRRPEMVCRATGERRLRSELPIGALYDVAHYHDFRTGADGRSVTCVLPNAAEAAPGHHWFIDGEASNCTRKGDETHRCWCRHGDVTHPETVHVDKVGDTCNAGAGSIDAGGWHGFLHGGQLVRA